MKRLLTLAFIVMCLSGCSSLDNKSQSEIRQVEFIKGCIVSTSMILQGSVDQNSLLQGCARMEHEYRQFEKQAEEKEAERERVPLSRADFMSGPSI